MRPAKIVLTGASIVAGAVGLAVLVTVKIALDSARSAGFCPR